MKKIVTVSLLIITLTSCTSMSEKFTSSPHFVEGKFQNTSPREGDRSFGKMVKSLFTEKRGDWPDRIENTFSPELKSDNEDSVVVTFIGHASFLIEIEHYKILIDPIFSQRSGPFSWLGAKRKRDPGLTIDRLPKVDAILVSHNHYDHLDLPTLQTIQQKNNADVLIVVPLGDKDWLEKEGLSNVVELDWWESTKIGSSLEVHFTPAQHSSGRGFFDRDKSFWGSYVLKHPTTQIFHGGDTGSSDHFRTIGERFEIDLSLLPIGAYKPQWFLQYVHTNPEEALKAHIDLKSKKSFGMHNETFSLSALSYLEAEDDLEKARDGSVVTKDDFDVIRVGQSYRYLPHSN